ncbi:MAG: Rpn family recombination-promoting nuclease/putative transposase, partial [Peptostreptococcaceae bacterium]|nr:Rpn family recombination-promoting nuclease/putative transposase [Peptostreptococcaceae bacterium]
DLEIARDFLRSYLPKALCENMDFSSLSIQKDSYVDGKLQEYFSDILYRFRLNGQEAYLYLLFEHKSYPDADTALQLLTYIVQIYQGLRKQKRRGLLPPVIPFVFYHGREPWKTGTKFSERIEGYAELPEEVCRYLPDFEYLLYDLARYPQERLQGEIPLLIFLRMQKSIFAEGEELFRTLSDTLRLLEKLSDKKRKESLFELMIRYLFYARDDVELEEATQEVCAISQERGKQLMTIAAKLLQEGWEKGKIEGKREGRLEGRLEGKREGRLEGKREGKLEEALLIAENMLRMGAEEEFVTRATQLSREEVQEIRKKLSQEK